MKYVNVQEENGIAIITITREEALNALNNDVLADLEAAFDSLNLDTTRCAIVTGSGQKSFVAGADIAYMKDLDEKGGREFSTNGNNVFKKIQYFPIPVIAAVNGYALGGGCELSMACDIRIASENAMFGQPETGLGIIPGFGGTQRLARLVPMGMAKEMIYAGTNIKADKALEIGLVNAVYPVDQLMDAAKKLAGKICRNAPIAVRTAKKAINEGIDSKLDDGLKLEAEVFGKCFNSEDQTEGMSAFLEKRKEKNFQNK